MLTGEAKQRESVESSSGSSSGSSTRSESFFTCSICQRAYPSTAALGQHLATHLPVYVPEDGEEAETLTCDLCEGEFSNPEALVLHLWTHARESDGGDDAEVAVNGEKDRPAGEDSEDERVTCDLCGEEFPNADGLVLHLWQHARQSDEAGEDSDGEDGEDGEDPGNGQGGDSGSGNGAEDGVSKKGPEDGVSKKGAEDGVSQKGTEDGVSKKGAEDGVNEDAVSEDDVNQADGDTAKEAKPLRYTCKRCGKMYSSKMSLYCHRKAHDLVTCDLCSRTFQGRRGLNIHRKKSHYNEAAPAEKAVAATETSAAKTEAAAAAAKTEAADSSGGPDFKCPQCLKVFQNQSWLTRHLCAAPRKPASPAPPALRSRKKFRRGQGGDRPHRCTFCPWSFKSLGHLKEHLLLVHLRVKPFECSTCDKKFSLKRYMNVHSVICKKKETI